MDHQLTTCNAKWEVTYVLCIHVILYLCHHIAGHSCIRGWLIGKFSWGRFSCTTWQYQTIVAKHLIGGRAGNTLGKIYDSCCTSALFPMHAFPFVMKCLYMHPFYTLRHKQMARGQVDLVHGNKELDSFTPYWPLISLTLSTTFHTPSCDGTYKIVQKVCM